MKNGISQTSIQNTKTRLYLLMLGSLAGAFVGAGAGYFWMIRSMSNVRISIFNGWLEWRIQHLIGLPDYLQMVGTQSPILQWANDVMRTAPELIFDFNEKIGQIGFCALGSAVLGFVLAALVVKSSNHGDQK